MGSGSFGVVRTCTISRFDLGIFGEKPKYAIKIMNKQAILSNKIYIYLLNCEMEILGSCHHPKIMTTHEVLEDRHNYYVVSEILKGGSVMNRLQYIG